MKTKLFNIKITFTLLMFAFILLFENCRRKDDCAEVQGPPPQSTHFDSLELTKIPDWKGDSLFFYSDTGDSVYIYCYNQLPPNNYESKGYTNPLPCNYTVNNYYPYQAYYYRSNEPTLNGLYVEFYKDPNSYPYNSTPSTPLSRIVIGDLGAQWLSKFGYEIIPQDSIILLDGTMEQGWLNGVQTVLFNINIGVLRLKQKNGTTWKLYRYWKKN